MPLHKYHYRPTPADQLARHQAGLRLFGAVDVQLPPAVDLRPFQLPVRDQGQEGCCSGFAAAALREGARTLAGSLGGGYLSPAYLYWRTRLAEGSFPQDAGATIGDEIETLENYGVCPESMLPYDQQATEAGTPACDVAAQPMRVLNAVALNCRQLILIKHVLAQGQFVQFGTPVYSSFEENVGADGMVPVPAPGEEMLGGHSMLACGYDDATSTILVRNSWGPTWGDSGYCHIPYSLVVSWMEAWTIPSQ